MACVHLIFQCLRETSKVLSLRFGKFLQMLSPVIKIGVNAARN